MPSNEAPSTTVIHNTKIDVASLETVDFARLAASEPDEVAKLLQAATSPGFFYLDLHNEPSARKLLDDLPLVYEVAERYFDQPRETKMEDFRHGQNASLDRGYKQSECDETFEMSDDEFAQGQLALSGVLGQHAELLQDFSRLCHSACQTMLSRLSDALQLERSERFENHHRGGHASNSGLKLIYEPSLDKLASVGDNTHTDSGTFTFLFYDQWGLHVQLPEARNWAFAAPVPGCALINVANSLERLSGKKLHSPVHRVTQPVDGFAKRYYISYFLRPERALQERWAAA